jgi:hypothetical protein
MYGLHSYCHWMSMLFQELRDKSNAVFGMFFWNKLFPRLSLPTQLPYTGLATMNNITMNRIMSSTNLVYLWLHVSFGGYME